MKKILYLWERLGLKRIEVITQEDTAKQPEIQPAGVFAKIHQKILDARRKKQPWKR